jgi:CII-binding regulator of phage lambda lysogenization HflD
MSTVRRRLIRQHDTSVQSTQARFDKSQRLRATLVRERAALLRWQTRLKRAFNSVDQIQKRIARIEKQLINLET